MSTNVSRWACSHRSSGDKKLNRQSTKASLKFSSSCTLLFVNYMPIWNWENSTFLLILKKKPPKETHQFSAQFAFLYVVLSEKKKKLQYRKTEYRISSSFVTFHDVERNLSSLLIFMVIKSCSIVALLQTYL